MEGGLSRLKKAPYVVVAMALIALAGITLLQARADASRAAQLRIERLTLLLSDLQSAPFNADPHAGGSPKAALAEVRSDEATLRGALSGPGALTAPGGQLLAGRRDLASISVIAMKIYAIACSRQGLQLNLQLPSLQGGLTVGVNRLSALLARVGRADAGRALNARRAAGFGTAAVIVVLVGAFLLLYRRSARARAAAEQLARENERLWSISRVEASTDALTGLGNRRALNRDLRHAIAGASEDEDEVVLAIFDLNGFKLYNDTFGHGAGDGLLSRLGGRLRSAVGDSGTAFRMGGDEFCVLAACSPERAQEVIAACSEALSESGSGWSIDSSCGTAWIPSEADTPAAAMRIADQRMYAGKATRSSASRELTGVLLQVLVETSEELGEHSHRVASLAGALAGELGLPGNAADGVAEAARLHDVGKTAVPAEILDKPGPLTTEEWEFIHRVPLVGERIMMSSATLATVASLMRSAHERGDGTGYPDRLTLARIPLGARIIAVCDAFDALTSGRPYRDAVSEQDALAELRRCVGSQFDPDVVAGLARVLDARAGVLDQRSLSSSAS